MTVHFMGTELEDFPVRLVVTAHNTSSNFRRANVRCAIMISPNAEDAAYIETSPAFSLSDFWTHFVFAANNSSGTQYICKWYAGGTQKLGLRWSNASQTIELAKWTGAAWSSLGTATDPILYAMPANFAAPFDIYIKLGNPGEFRCYFSNTVAISLTGIDLSGIANIDKVRFNPAGNSSWTYYFSEVLLTNWNTIGCKYFTRAPLGNGTYQEWTNGAFGIVDEVEATNADLATSATVDQRTTYTYGSTLPALVGGEVIAAAKLAFAANRDAAGPQNINAMTRISSTDYHDSNQALNITATRLGKMWETSPATAVAWTVTELNAAEFGVRSRT